MIELKGKYGTAKIMIGEIESGLYDQIYSVLNSPVAKDKKIVIQPDCHVGSGICVGFTMELSNKINPNWIGVDIGCGMISAKFSGKTKMDLPKINTKIREQVPMGFNIHESPQKNDIPYSEIQSIANIFTKKWNKKFRTKWVAPTYNENWLKTKMKMIGITQKNFWGALGTLGGGNHFIEIGKSDSGDYWVTIHTGSRNFGLKIAKYWTKVANGKVKKVSKEYTDKRNEIIQNSNKKEIGKKLEELKIEYGFGISKEYLDDDNAINYIYDMIFAQQYSLWNRQLILDSIINIIGTKTEETIHSIHNYIDFKDFIIRKGAISSYTDKKMIIPFNMRDGILICEGKSNPDWNFSAPHGAGRVMSRTEAKYKVDFDKFKRTMRGIYSTSISKNTLDESPFAYKKSKIIEKAIEPTATIIERVKPILNIKDDQQSISWKEIRKKGKK